MEDIMTKEKKLLAFIKAGENGIRRWKDCRAFYTTLCEPFFFEGENRFWFGEGSHILTADDAKKANERYYGRAMDFALYRIEEKGWTKNIAHGLHQAM